MRLLSMLFIFVGRRFISNWFQAKIILVLLCLQRCIIHISFVKTNNSPIGRVEMGILVITKFQEWPCWCGFLPNPEHPSTSPVWEPCKNMGLLIYFHWHSCLCEPATLTFLVYSVCVTSEYLFRSDCWDAGFWIHTEVMWEKRGFLLRWVEDAGVNGDVNGKCLFPTGMLK